MSWMNEQLGFLQNCVKDVQVTHDESAVEVLRAIVERAAAVAPVDALLELAQTLIAIRKRDLRREAEAN